MFDFFSVLNASTTDTSMDKPVTETSSLSLPQNLAKFLPTGQDIKMAFTFYREPNLFPVREMQMDVDRSIVGSPVIGATVSGLPNGTELDPPVQVTLVLTHAPTPSEDENRTILFYSTVLSVGFFAKVKGSAADKHYHENRNTK